MPLIEGGMVLISSILDTLTPFPFGQMEFLRYALIDVKADMGLEFIEAFPVISPAHKQIGIHKRSIYCYQLCQFSVFLWYYVFYLSIQTLENFLKLEKVSFADSFIKGAFLDTFFGSDVFSYKIIFFHGLEKLYSGFMPLEMIEDQHFQLMFEGKSQRFISKNILLSIC